MTDWTDLLNRNNTNSPTQGDLDRAQQTVLLMTPAQRKLFISWLEVIAKYEKLAPIPRGGPDDR
jgi:hypothetical protein